ncbi:SseB family protein, partial [Micromonospora noduli]|uniref:SseB family protein n=1 Tax=Micromonospora noduli TaxID=709876 RepID=UPI0015EC8F40
MTAWEPATEAEVAMRDALRANDQELYFRLLSRTDVLLPVSAPTQPGQPPAGWGTWTTGGRTHVLAFTSAAALRACLGDHAGGNRRIPFADLAASWPNHEWWLAVNPGLPVEGYLPAWFVSQLSRGDVRLPGRAMGARARLERAETLARTRPGMPPRDAAPAAGSPPVTAATSSGPESAPLAPRRPARSPGPRVGAPPVPGPAPRPPVSAEPPRRGGEEDLPAAGQRHPTEPPRPAPGNGALPRTGRPSRFTPLATAGPTTDQAGPGVGWPAATRPGDVDGPAPGNGNGGPQAAPRRSFFDPSPARDPA